MNYVPSFFILNRFILKPLTGEMDFTMAICHTRVIAPLFFKQQTLIVHMMAQLGLVPPEIN